GDGLIRQGVLDLEASATDAGERQRHDLPSSYGPDMERVPPIVAAGVAAAMWRWSSSPLPLGERGRGWGVLFSPLPESWGEERKSGPFIEFVTQSSSFTIRPRNSTRPSWLCRPRWPLSRSRPGCFLPCCSLRSSRLASTIWVPFSSMVTF